MIGPSQCGTSPLDDWFDDPSSLADWQRVNQVEGWNADRLQQWNVDQTQPGRMVMQPHSVVWYKKWRGPMVFKEVAGDFIFTTEVQIGDRDDLGDRDADDIPNEAAFSLGGLMIRTPRDITSPAVDWQPGIQLDDGRPGIAWSEHSDRGTSGFRLFNHRQHDGFQTLRGKSGEVHQHVCDWLIRRSYRQQASPEIGPGLHVPGFEVDSIGGRHNRLVTVLIQSVEAMERNQFGSPLHKF
jgi:hypothetical protein